MSKFIPQPLDTYWATGCCPDCGCQDFFELPQDGGHDHLIKCSNCGTKLGLLMAGSNPISIDRVTTEHSFCEGYFVSRSGK